VADLAAGLASETPEVVAAPDEPQPSE